MKWLEDSHALITGGGSGIGASTAAYLGAAGAKLSLLGRRPEPLREAAKRFGGTAVVCDVADRAALGDAFGQARAANGPIDLLIVNAGIGDSAPFKETSREAWDRMLAVNLSAPFDCVQAALPDLLASERGRIVFVASVAGLRGVAYAAHYAASKHGLVGLMRSLALEFARTPLTVNAVCPGFVDTPMTDQSVARIRERSGRSEEDSRAALERMNANGRLVSPDGVAALILTLCLPDSRDITGAALTIDGGTTA